MSKNKCYKKLKSYKKKRISPKTGSRTKEINKSKMEEVANNAKEFYEIRNDIIKIIKKARKEQTKEDRKSEKDEKIEEDEQSEGDNTGLNWIYGSKDQLRELIKKSWWH